MTRLLRKQLSASSNSRADDGRRGEKEAEEDGEKEEDEEEEEEWEKEADVAVSSKSSSRVPKLANIWAFCGSSWLNWNNLK